MCITCNNSADKCFVKYKIVNIIWQAYNHGHVDEILPAFMSKQLSYFKTNYILESGNTTKF